MTSGSQFTSNWLQLIDELHNTRLVLAGLRKRKHPDTNYKVDSSKHLYDQSCRHSKLGKWQFYIQKMCTATGIYVYTGIKNVRRENFCIFCQCLSSCGRFYGIVFTLCCCVCVHIYKTRLVTSLIWQQVQKTRADINPEWWFSVT